MGKQLLISQLGQLKKMLRDDPSWHVRETVALTLGMLGEYATVMQALYDTDRFVRDAARLALKQHLPQAIDMLVGTLAYGKPAEREQAACALGEMGIDTPIKNLENAALMDKSSTVRKAAVLALGQLEEHTPVATLSRVALLDRDEDVREAAKLVLSTIDLDIIAIEGLQTEKQTDALTADFHVDRETDNSFHSLPQQEEGNTPYIRSHSKKKGYIGYVLGSYKLIKQFDEHKGRGTHVYLGEHVSDRTHVAVKVFPPQTSDEEAESFRQAVAIIAQLKQKNIVPIISFDVGSGIPFIVMDYMSGGNVRQHYPEGQRVPFPTVIKFVKRIAEALQYAHNHKPAIIHQDIKPENLLFNAEGNIFLSDFGFEQSILRTSSNANRSAGPNYYIAPEQLHMSRKTSPATDQYTLAAIVYEWLCGRPLFEGKPTEIVRKIRSSTPPSLCEQVPQLPQQVENVVIQALAKQPLQRFASVQAFAQAFTAAFGI